MRRKPQARKTVLGKTQLHKLQHNELDEMRPQPVVRFMVFMFGLCTDLAGCLILRVFYIYTVDQVRVLFHVEMHVHT